MYTGKPAAPTRISAVLRCFRVLAAAVLVIAAADVLPPTASGQQAVSATEYEIYSVVLDSLYAHDFAQQYAVEDSTSGAVLLGSTDIVLLALDRSPAFSAELRSSYIANNGDPQLLAASEFAANKPVAVLPDPSDGQEHVTFSRVGFANSGEEAVVHVLYYCGGLCGGGKLVRLSRANGEWSIQEVRRTVRV